MSQRFQVKLCRNQFFMIFTQLLFILAKLFSNTITTCFAGNSLDTAKGSVWLFITFVNAITQGDLPLIKLFNPFFVKLTIAFHEVSRTLLRSIIYK